MKTSSTSRRWLFASFFTALLGIVTTGILSVQHYRIAEQGLMQKSFCTFSSVFDCDTVLTSAYAHVWRIPNAELGLLFFLTLAVLSLWALLSKPQIRAYLCLLSGVGSLYSLYLAYLLYTKLQVICIFCSASHLLNWAIFIFSLLALREPSTERKEWLKPAVMTIAIYGLGLLFFFGFKPKAHQAEPELNVTALLEYFYKQPVLDMKLPGARPTWGPEDAPITIVDFSDFQCPHCRRAAFSLKPYLGEYRKFAKIVYMNFPLDGACNPAIKGNMHPAACTAAKAALCTYRDKGNDAFWKFHDLIFLNQQRLSHHVITEELGPQVGFTVDALAQCLVDPKIETELAEDIALGTQLNLRGTPSVYINGRLLQSWTYPKAFRTILEYELKRVRGEWQPPEVKAGPKTEEAEPAE